MASAGVFLFLISSLSVFLISISGQFNFVESLPLSQGKRQNVVYTRYVRRRPIPYTNNYVREVIEVFKTHRRPPPYAFLHDEDLTRFVRCDFDPSMPDCNEETNSAPTTQRSSTSEGSPMADVSTTTPPSTSSTTLASSSSWWNRRTESSTTTTTTTQENIEKVVEIQLPELRTSTFKPVVLEEIDDKADKSEDDNNGNEYDDDGKNKDSIDPNETEYYDEGEEDENNNSEEATNNDPVEAEVDIDDADSEVEIQTEETTINTTKKSFLNWF